MKEMTPEGKAAEYVVVAVYPLHIFEIGEKLIPESDGNYYVYGDEGRWSIDPKNYPAIFQLAGQQSPTHEAVAVAFGEWLRKEDYEPIGNHWQKGYYSGERSWHHTSDLFTLFTAAPEYKELTK